MILPLLLQVEAPKITDWITAIAAVLGTAAALYVLIQNTRVIRTARDSFQLALSPKLDIIEYPNSKNDFSFVIQNASNLEIIDIEAFTGRYGVSGNPPDIKEGYRAPYLGIRVTKLGPMEKFSIDGADLLTMFPNPKHGKNEMSATNTLTFVYRRKLDLKQFCDVHLFGGEFHEDNGKLLPYVMPFNGRESSAGRFAHVIQSNQLLIDTELNSVGFTPIYSLKKDA